jgi:hypothetical protein
VPGRSTDSQLAWTSASSREDGSDVFNDSYFCGSGSSEVPAARTAATLAVMAEAAATEAARPSLISAMA